MEAKLLEIAAAVFQPGAHDGKRLARNQQRKRAIQLFPAQLDEPLAIVAYRAGMRSFAIGEQQHANLSPSLRSGGKSLAQPNVSSSGCGAMISNPPGGDSSSISMGSASTVAERSAPSRK